MHYVCSDLHGRYDKYKEIVESISEKDTLYILGDVIDRYPDGLKILNDIMERNNIVFFMGNHEDMMYRSLIEGDWYYKGIWFNPCNGGKETYKSFVDGTETAYKVMFDNALLGMYLTVEDRKYYLAHAGFTRTEDRVLYKDLSSEDRHEAVWNSPFRLMCRYGCSMFEEMNHKDTLFIYGHTPVQHLHKDGEKGSYLYENIMCIDGGIATGDGYVILLCLESMKEHFI